MLCMSLNKFLWDIYFYCSITEKMIWRISSLDLMNFFWKFLDGSPCVNITHALMRTPHIDEHTAHWCTHHTLKHTPHTDSHTTHWCAQHTLMHTLVHSNLLSLLRRINYLITHQPLDSYLSCVLFLVRTFRVFCRVLGLLNQIVESLLLVCSLLKILNSKSLIKVYVTLISMVMSK